MGKKVIGIDLGTTNSVVAVMEGGETVIIPAAEGGRTVPSIVAFGDDGETLVGQPAKNQRTTNEDTISSIKRFMGRAYSEVATEREQATFKVVSGENGAAAVEINGKIWRPEQISAMILTKLKKDAEAYLGEEVTQAVITVPAYFNDKQREATKNAGKLAGLEVLRIVNEPTAAALAYGINKKEGKVLVFDLGGGTFDVSVLDIEDGTFEVKATSGNTHLGGDDYDRRIVEWLAKKFAANNAGIDLLDDPMAKMRLIEEAEKAKIALSAKTKEGFVTINIPYVTSTPKGAKHLKENLTRAEFEKITADLTDSCKVPVEDCLKEAGLTAAEIDEVIMVGGSTRMPAVQELVSAIFGEKKMHKGVNPDEVVGAGAAVQGGVLTGEVKGVLLLDVTPLSLCVTTKGGVATVMIARNTTIPCDYEDDFSTSADNQANVRVEVSQGQRALASDNRQLGSFSMPVAPARAGEPVIRIKFDIDANGILTVKATDALTKEEKTLVCKDSTSLDEKEIEKMVADAAAHAEEDEKRIEVTEARNSAEALADGADENREKYGAQLSQGLKDSLEAEAKAVRAALKANQGPELVTAYKALKESVLKIGGEIYGKDGAAATEEAPEAEAPEAGAPTPPASGPVVDKDPFEGV